CSEAGAVSKLIYATACADDTCTLAVRSWPCDRLGIHAGTCSNHIPAGSQFGFSIGPLPALRQAGFYLGAICNQQRSTITVDLPFSIPNAWIQTGVELSASIFSG